MAKKARKSVKKQSVAAKRGLTKPKKEGVMNNLPQNRAEWLELLITMTEKRMGPRVGSGVNKMLEAQVIRLKESLAEYLASQK